MKFYYFLNVILMKFQKDNEPISKYENREQFSRDQITTFKNL